MAGRLIDFVRADEVIKKHICDLKGQMKKVALDDLKIRLEAKLPGKSFTIPGIVTSIKSLNWAGCFDTQRLGWAEHPQALHVTFEEIDGCTTCTIDDTRPPAAPFPLDETFDKYIELALKDDPHNEPNPFKIKVIVQRLFPGAGIHVKYIRERITATMKGLNPHWTPLRRVVEPTGTLTRSIDIDHVNKELDNLIETAFHFQLEETPTASHLLRALNILCPDCGYTVDHMVNRVWARRCELAGTESSSKWSMACRLSPPLSCKRRQRTHRHYVSPAELSEVEEERGGARLPSIRVLGGMSRNTSSSRTPEQQRSFLINLPLSHPDQVFTEPDSPSQPAPAHYSVGSDLKLAQSDYTSTEEGETYMTQRSAVMYDHRQDDLVVPDPIFDAYLQVAHEQDEARNGKKGRNRPDKREYSAASEFSDYTSSHPRRNPYRHTRTRAVADILVTSSTHASGIPISRKRTHRESFAESSACPPKLEDLHEHAARDAT